MQRGADHRMLQRSLAAIAFLACSFGVQAQETPPSSYVESDGEATIYGVPTQVEFWLHMEKTGETVAEAMTAVEGFDDQLGLEMESRDIHPADYEYYPPTVTELKQRRVYAGARLRFPMTAFAKPEQGPQQFAALCDQMLGLAEAVECDITGPLLDVADRAILEKQAVAAATERAFPAADAVAGSLKTGIWAVDTVRVLEVNWNRPLFSLAAEPNLRQISCTAKVRVTYALQETQP